MISRTTSAIVEAPHHFPVADIFERRHLAANGESSAGLENALLHFVQAVKTLAVQDGHQLCVRQQLPGQRVLYDAAVAAGEGVVVADDGVLHGVGERQQHHQVERYAGFP